MMFMYKFVPIDDAYIIATVIDKSASKRHPLYLYVML